MPPKKSAKAKKDEVVEIPKASTLPDGKKTFYFGGWSTLQSLTSLQQLTQEAELKVATATSDPQNFQLGTLYVLPGETVEKSDPECEVKLRDIEIIGILPEERAERQREKERLAAAAAAALAAQGAGQEEEEGGAPAAEGGEDEDGKAEETIKEKPLLLNEAVKFRTETTQGRIVLTGAEPLPIPKPAPVEEKAPPAAAGKGKQTAKEKAAAAAAAAAAEKEREAQVALAAQEPEKGAKPSSWPTVSLRNICFEGCTVVVKGIHVNFHSCHFVGGEMNQLEIHQYCNVKLENCTFSCPSKSALYLFPLSSAIVSHCSFSGTLHPTTEEEAENMQNMTVPAKKREDILASKSTGIFVDNGKLNVTACKFLNLSVGIMFHDESKGSEVLQSNFKNIFSTAAILDGCIILLKGNVFDHCDFYSIQARNGAKGQILKNDIMSQVRLEKGSRPFMHSNVCRVRMIDYNDCDAVYMQPKY